MKIAEIDYITLSSGKIKIKNFRNIATDKEIREEFGNNVHHKYFHSGYPAFKNHISDKEIFYIKIDERDVIIIIRGSVFTKGEFNQLILTMKAAAKCLIKIRKLVKNYEVKTIKI